MKFAFLIHYLSDETRSLMRLNRGGSVLSHWGLNVLEFCASVRQSMEALRRSEGAADESAARLADELAGLVSRTGARAEGRLYEIPMTGREILEDPHRAMGLMEKAVDAAADWGARVVGLGSMTGVVGGNGSHLAGRGPVAVTTGNSLTVYAALQNLYNACEEAGVDLARETVAVVGVPGSIATAVASLLALRCRSCSLARAAPAPSAWPANSAPGSCWKSRPPWPGPASWCRPLPAGTASTRGNCAPER